MPPLDLSWVLQNSCGTFDCKEQICIDSFADFECLAVRNHNNCLDNVIACCSAGGQTSETGFPDLLMY